MAFNFENLVNKIKDTASNVVQKTASSTADAILGQEKANELRREHERTAIPEITSYYMNADQEPIDIPNKKTRADFGSVNSDVVPKDDQDNKDDSEDEHTGSSARIQSVGSNLEPSFTTSNGGYIYDENNRNDLHNIEREFSEWEKENNYTGIEADARRRFLDSEGNLKNPLEWNLLGFTSQNKTPDEAKRVYDYYFAQEDESPVEEGSEEWEQKRGTWGRSVKGKNSTAAPALTDMAWGSMGFNFYDDPLYQQQIASAAEVPMQAVVSEDAIDNGISKDARESIWMTGDRYYDYVTKYGLPGRDPSDIDRSPNAIYNKQDEMEKYGFIPYLVSDEGISKFHDDAAASAVNNAFNDFANLRKDNTSYSFNYDGNRYDGKDFVNKYSSWVGKALNSDSESFTDPSLVNESSVPLTWCIVDDVTGETVYAPSPNGEPKMDPETGQPMIDFHTGNPDDNWYFNDDEDMKSVKYEFAGDSHPAYAWRDIEPLVLSDGQKIRADKAMDLYDNQQDYADYGMFDWGKPSVANPLEEGGWAPWLVDMALGSAPLFWGPTAATQAIGNTYQNMQGFRAGAQDDNGTYRLLSEDPTREQQLVTSLGSAALPITEKLWGIGRAGAASVMPGAKLLKERFPDLFENPLAILLGNAFGEGVEEIPGNLVEEMQSAGTLGDYFADDLYYYLDDDKNKVYTTLSANPDNPDEKYFPAYDKQGKRLKDQRTSVLDRNANFWEEAPLSMLGGALLGGTLGIGEAAQSVKPYLENREERRKFGYNLEVPEEVLNYTRRQQEGE